MTPYSIAIRTLGTAGEKYIRELESIKRQTVQPDKVVVYIAEGYDKPAYTIGIEQYVYVKKGMVAQRALPYTEIHTPLVMLLDDDVELAPDSAQKMIDALEKHNLDCIAADTFQNHKMSLGQKVYAAMTNLVFPHHSDTWAFKVHGTGSFSYNNNPTKDVYLSQSAAGPASLWRKETLLAIHLEHEMWLERFGFAYGDDAVIFNKLYKNGYNLGIHYNSGILNLDAKTSSGNYQSNLMRFYTRSKATTLIWYRTCYHLPGNSAALRAWLLMCYAVKAICLIPIHLIASIKMHSHRVIANYARGIIDAVKTIRSTEFKQLPNYIINR